MKLFIGIILGILLSFGGLSMTSWYYKKYVVPQQLVNFYVSCIAKHSNRIQRGESKTKQSALEICMLFDNQIEQIEDSL